MVTRRRLPISGEDVRAWSHGASSNKLRILADAAKYDASCASSGTDRRHSLRQTGGIGSTEGMGICHAYTYGSYGLRRVYYSAFSPIPDASSGLPSRPAPLLRDRRLYQADWMLRFYGFAAPELPTNSAGNLALEMDPKLAWALAHREKFPVDVNFAAREALLRVRVWAPNPSTASCRRAGTAQYARRPRPAAAAAGQGFAVRHRAGPFSARARRRSPCQNLPRQGELFA